MNPTNCCDSVYMIRSLVLEDTTPNTNTTNWQWDDNSDLQWDDNSTVDLD